MLGRLQYCANLQLTVDSFRHFYCNTVDKLTNYTQPCTVAMFMCIVIRAICRLIQWCNMGPAIN